MKTKHFLISTLFALAQLSLFSQDGQLDTSFGSNGIVVTDFFGGIDFGFAVAQQNDGKLVAVGSSEVQFDNFDPALVRYLPDGSVDTSFGTNGFVTTDFGPWLDIYYDVQIQNDDKIVAAGQAGTPNNKDFLITRYQPNGDLDTTFGTNGSVITDLGQERFGALIIQNDGKTLMSGGSVIAGGEELILLRFLTDGSPDISFGDNGISIIDLSTPAVYVSQMKVMDDGKILLGARVNGVYQLFKFNSDGSADLTFGTNGVVSTGVVSWVSNSFDITDSGKIFVAATRDLSGDAVEGVLITYLPDGTLDTSFGNNGFVISTIPNFSPRKVLIQENQRVLIFGFIPDFFEGGEMVVARYWLNGGLDTSFNSDGIVESNFEGGDMILQNDGKIVTMGMSWWYDGDEDFILYRYQNDPLGVDDQIVKGLKVFPNPTQNIVTITYDFILNSNVPYQINDIAGKVLIKGELSGDRAKVDLSSFQSGMYFLKAANTTIRLIRE